MKSAEVVDIFLFCDENGVHDLLRKQRAQTRYASLYVHRAPPMRQIMISSAAI